ncbi:MAG: helix-turn-helix domain-containing protein [Desulfosudis oleivorans]|nr:helix-turn-helix domain-containing protein [Desulfosudis oleivorans]
MHTPATRPPRPPTATTGPRRRGAGPAHKVSPARKSSPRRRMLSPGGVSWREGARSPVRVTCSCITTVSAPAGSGAPVKIRIALPGASCCGALPQLDSPATGSSKPCAARSAMGHGATVHGGVVERRVVDRGGERARQGAAEAVRERDVFDPVGRTQAREQRGTGLVETQHGRFLQRGGYCAGLRPCGMPRAVVAALGSGLSWAPMKKIPLVADALGELRQAYLFADADDAQCTRLCQGMRGDPAPAGRDPVPPRPAGVTVLLPALRPGEAVPGVAGRARKDHRDRPPRPDLRRGGNVHGRAGTLPGELHGDRRLYAVRLRPEDLPAGAARVARHRLRHARRHEPAPAHAGQPDREPDPAERHLPTGDVPAGAGAAATLNAADVELTTPKSALASRLAIQPETFSRILAKLRDQNLISVDGPHIMLRNLAGLRDLVYLPAAEPPRL